MSGVVPATYTPLPPPLDEEAAARQLAHLEEEAAPLAAMARGDGHVRNLLAAVFGASPFLTRVIHSEPDFAAACFTDDPAALFDCLLAATAEAAGLPDEAAVMSRLRILRRKVALLAALADISGLWPMEEVTARLTAFADAALSAALSFATAQAHRQGKLRSPEARESGLFILAMGKHGAGELNYSSDIDLIVFYDETRGALAEGVEAAPFYVRLTRQVMKILSDITGDGYVFRTDLRLRPDPGSTQVAMSVQAAEVYYQTLGQNWERAAMIKARPAAGDIALGEEFLEMISPWIWRRHLDFAAIADVASLKRQIHAVKGHGEIAIAGHNLKLGRGGIREIEFFVQTQQLIAGGRNPALRGRSTLAMLDALAAENWIEPAVAGELKEAYRFLRTLEHRIQMRLDQQTHELPSSETALEELARFAGFPSRDALANSLRATLERVQEHYNALFEDAGELGTEVGSLVFTGADDDPETLETLSRMGFARPADASAIVRGWHYGRYPATRSPAARERLTELLPALLAAMARAGDADSGLAAFDRFLEGLPAGLQLFSLLRANPHLLDLLVTILVTAPELATRLSRRPRLFDTVLAPDFFAPLPGHEEYREMLREAAPPELSVEEVLDAARLFANEQKFRIGVRMITETVTPREASLAYTALADVQVERMLEVAREQMRQAHGELPGSSLCVLAMGKLGGCEMTATSDLDLIVICDYPKDAEGSTGPRSIAPGRYFARLTQRLITALSAPTAEGVLYEVDMRLRPSGSQGPVATHVESFRRYQAESAWIWEYMALTRARVIAGSGKLRRQVEEIIRQTLTRRREADEVRAAALKMRSRIHEEKPPRSVWDMKLARGGLNDIEFIAQSLQLIHASGKPQVLARDTESALRNLAGAGALSESDAKVLLEAHGLYHHLTHILRLCLREGFAGDDAPEGFTRLVANAASAPDLAAASALLEETQGRVGEIFTRLIGEYF